MSILRRIIPEPICLKIINTSRFYWYVEYKKIKDYYSNKQLTSEQKRSLRFLKNHRFCLNGLNMLYVSNLVNYYKFKYRKINIYDHVSGIKYVIHQNKKLFFKRGLQNEAIRDLYAQFLYELDSRSPHCYCRQSEKLSNCTLFDCGAAEGLFSLCHIDELKHVVIFECDKQWIEALRLTFAPYSEKVTIIEKYVSDINDINNISIDQFIDSSMIVPDFIKMDIEGFEEKAIFGAQRLLSSAYNIHFAICTYHKPYAEEDISNTMNTYDYYPSYNNGYMIATFEDKLIAPYLRRGVIHYLKKSK